MAPLTSFRPEEPNMPHSLSTVRAAIAILVVGSILARCVTIAAEPPLGPEAHNSFADSKLGLKLESPADYVLAIRTSNYRFDLPGTLCEFTADPAGKPRVPLAGALIHDEQGQAVGDYASFIADQYNRLNAPDSIDSVSEQKLDRKPG